MDNKRLDYLKQYDKTNCVQFKMKLNKNTMADVVEWLNKQDNKQGYMLDLIRKDIAKKQ